jgi:hypothetical protein
VPSAKFKVAPKDLGRYEKRLSAGVFKRAVKEGQMEAAKASLHLLQQRTRTAPPASANGGRGAVDTEAFLKGWKVESSGLETAVRNRAKHAVFVEEGRKAGRPPPVRALIPWVRRKLGPPTELLGAVAFLVARAIGRRGLWGRFILAGAIQKIDKIHTAAVSKALEKALRNTR